MASAVINELSLNDLHIKNNAMTSLKFVTTVLPAFVQISL